MNDKELKRMEGRWYLQYSGCPLWKRGSIDTISFNYDVQHKGEELVLHEQVEYRKNGKMKMKRGFEIPVEGTESFSWKGAGMNRIFRNGSRVLHLQEGMLVMWFERTLSTPESIDVLTRKKHLNAQESTHILQLVANLPEASPYLADLESVNIL